MFVQTSRNKTSRVYVQPKKKKKSCDKNPPHLHFLWLFIFFFGGGGGVWIKNCFESLKEPIVSSSALLSSPLLLTVPLTRFYLASIHKFLPFPTSHISPAPHTWTHWPFILLPFQRLHFSSTFVSLTHIILKNPDVSILFIITSLLAWFPLFLSASLSPFGHVESSPLKPLGIFFFFSRTLTNKAPGWWREQESEQKVFWTIAWKEKRE